MEYLKSVLSTEGDMSALRLMSLLSLLFGAVIAFWGVYVGKDLMGLSVLVGVFVGSAFGGKIAQKSFEVKESIESSK